jgi:hypothetical protein
MVSGKTCLNGAIVTSAGLPRKIKSERLVGFCRRVPGDAPPEIFLGDRRHIAKRPGSLHGGMDGGLRNECISASGGAASAV